MILSFRQGLLRSNNDNFLVSPSAVTLRVISIPLEISIAYKTHNYYHIEAKTVTNAWVTPNNNPNTVYLYIELDSATAERSFGVATQNQIVSPTAPTVVPITLLPITNGQHWFDTTNKVMKVYLSQTQKWVEKIRIFVATYTNGAPPIPYSFNKISQIGVAGSNRTGRILYDSLGKALRISDGTFLTSEVDFHTYGGVSNSVRMESDITLANAAQNIPAFSVVAISGYGGGSSPLIEVADYNDINETLIAICTDELSIGDVTSITTRGVIINDLWDWPAEAATAGQRLWIGMGAEAGQLVLIDPSVVNPAIPKKPSIARVLSSNSIIFQQSFESAGTSGVQGVPGISLNVIGPLATVANLPPSNNNVNDAYSIDFDGRLYVWNGTTWYDAGQFRGQDGVIGSNGVDGADGADGADGVDGLDAPSEYTFNKLTFGLTTYTLQESDKDKVVVFDASATCTLTLPSGNTLSVEGWRGYVSNSQGGQIRVVTSGGDVITGGFISKDPFNLAHFYLETQQTNSIWRGAWNLRQEFIPLIDENNPFTNFIDANGTEITLIFDEDLTPIPYTTAGWTVYADGVPISVSSIDTDGQSVFVTLSGTIYVGQQINLYYDDIAGTLSGDAGDVVSFSTIVENGSTVTTNVLRIENVGTETNTLGTVVYVKFNMNITGTATLGWTVFVGGDISPIISGSITDDILTLNLNTSVEYKVYAGLQVVVLYDHSIGNIANVAQTLVLFTTNHSVTNNSLVPWTPDSLGASLRDYGMCEAYDLTNNIYQTLSPSGAVSDGSPVGYWKGRKNNIIFNYYAHPGYAVYRPYYDLANNGIAFDSTHRLATNNPISVSSSSPLFIGISYYKTSTTSSVILQPLANIASSSHVTTIISSSDRVGDTSGASTVLYRARTSSDYNVVTTLTNLNTTGLFSFTRAYDGSTIFAGARSSQGSSEIEGAVATSSYTNQNLQLYSNSASPVYCRRWIVHYGATISPPKRELVRQWLRGEI